jgi:hypothetical protein
VIYGAKNDDLSRPPTKTDVKGKRKGKKGWVDKR